MTQIGWVTKELPPRASIGKRMFTCPCAAARIAAVVEAERPANRPTLKGLIHDDVDKKTEELYRRIQSLEAKLGETKNALKRKTATSGDTATPKRKKQKTRGATPRSRTRRRGLPSPLPP